MRVAHAAQIVIGVAFGLVLGLLIGLSSCRSAAAVLEGRSPHEHAVITYADAALASRRASHSSPHSPGASPPTAAAIGAASPAAASPAAASPAAASPVTASPTASPAPVARWLQPDQTALVFNAPALAVLNKLTPARTTLHYSFGSAVMMDFVRNWLHFIRQAQLSPYLIGTADAALLKFCDGEGVAAAAISPDLDVWTYKRKPKAKSEARAKLHSYYS